MQSSIDGIDHRYRAAHAVRRSGVVTVGNPARTVTSGKSHANTPATVPRMVLSTYRWSPLRWAQVKISDELLVRIRKLEEALAKRQNASHEPFEKRQCMWHHTPVSVSRWCVYKIHFASTLTTDRLLMAPPLPPSAAISWSVRAKMKRSQKCLTLHKIYLP